MKRKRILAKKSQKTAGKNYKESWGAPSIPLALQEKTQILQPGCPLHILFSFLKIPFSLLLSPPWNVFLIFKAHLICHLNLCEVFSAPSRQHRSHPLWGSFWVQDPAKVPGNNVLWKTEYVQDRVNPWVWNPARTEKSRENNLWKPNMGSCLYLWVNCLLLSVLWRLSKKMPYVMKGLKEGDSFLPLALGRIRPLGLVCRSLDGMTWEQQVTHRGKHEQNPQRGKSPKCQEMPCFRLPSSSLLPNSSSWRLSLILYTHTHTHTHTLFPSRDCYSDSSVDSDLSLPSKPRPLSLVAWVFPWAPDTMCLTSESLDLALLP